MLNRNRRLKLKRKIVFDTITNIREDQKLRSNSLSSKAAHKMSDLQQLFSITNNESFSIAFSDAVLSFCKPVITLLVALQAVTKSRPSNEAYDIKSAQYIRQT